MPAGPLALRPEEVLRGLPESAVLLLRAQRELDLRLDVRWGQADEHCNFYGVRDHIVRLALVV
eukprot:12805473-Alexandrium_andersonii.AAC.1